MRPYGIIWLYNNDYHFIFLDSTESIVVEIGIGQNIFVPITEVKFIIYKKIFDWSLL